MPVNNSIWNCLKKHEGMRPYSYVTCLIHGIRYPYMLQNWWSGYQSMELKRPYFQKCRLGPNVFSSLRQTLYNLLSRQRLFILSFVKWRREYLMQLLEPYYSKYCRSSYKHKNRRSWWSNNADWLSGTSELCVCVYVCVYVCTYVCMHLCLYVCTYVMCIHIYRHCIWHTK